MCDFYEKSDKFYPKMLQYHQTKIHPRMKNNNKIRNNNNLQ